MYLCTIKFISLCHGVSCLGTPASIASLGKRSGKMRLHYLTLKNTAPGLSVLSLLYRTEGIPRGTRAVVNLAGHNVLDPFRWPSYPTFLFYNSFSWTYDLYGPVPNAFEMRATPLRGQVGGAMGLGPGNREFCGPCEMTSSRGARVPFAVMYFVWDSVSDSDPDSIS